MLKEIMKVYASRRISPKGEKYIGICILCGRDNLTIKDSNTYCSNPNNLTWKEAVELLSQRKN